MQIIIIGNVATAKVREKKTHRNKRKQIEKATEEKTIVFVISYVYNVFEIRRL